MAISEEMVMPVAPAYSGANSGFGGFGNDGWWIILLFILLGNNGFGFGGGFDGGIYPWMNQNNQINDGFRDQILNTTAGFGDVQNSLCAGFAGVNASINNAQNALAQQMYNNQIADLERSFAVQSATSDLKYTVATENCADRQAVSDGVKDILAATQAQTQAILNQLCSDKIEQKNDLISQLRSELMYARGQASQDVQTAAIQAGQRSLANEVEQYVAPKAIPAYIVQNPNCCTMANGCGSF